jgi:hypothetical protein
VAAKRHEKGRVLHGARPEFQFVPVLATQIALGICGCARLAARNHPSSIHFGPEGSVHRVAVCNRYALDIPADFDAAILNRLLSVLEPRC